MEQEESSKGQTKTILPRIFVYSLILMLFVFYQFNLFAYLMLNFNFVLLAPLGVWSFLLYLHKFKGMTGETFARFTIYTVIMFFLIFYFMYWSGDKGIVFAASWRCCSTIPSNCDSNCKCYYVASCSVFECGLPDGNNICASCDPDVCCGGYEPCNNQTPSTCLNTTLFCTSTCQYEVNDTSANSCECLIGGTQGECNETTETGCWESDTNIESAGTIRCCGDDAGESWCSNTLGVGNYYACSNAVFSIDGDYSTKNCECGIGETQGTCGAGDTEGCWITVPNMCCGDDAGEDIASTADAVYGCCEGTALADDTWCSSTSGWDDDWQIDGLQCTKEVYDIATSGSPISGDDIVCGCSANAANNAYICDSSDVFESNDDADGVCVDTTGVNTYACDLNEVCYHGGEYIGDCSYCGYTVADNDKCDSNVNSGPYSSPNYTADGMCVSGGSCDTNGGVCSDTGTSGTLYSDCSNANCGKTTANSDACMSATSGTSYSPDGICVSGNACDTNEVCAAPGGGTIYNDCSLCSEEDDCNNDIGTSWSSEGICIADNSNCCEYWANSTSGHTDPDNCGTSNDGGTSVCSGSSLNGVYCDWVGNGDENWDSGTTAGTNKYRCDGIDAGDHPACVLCTATNTEGAHPNGGSDDNDGQCESGCGASATCDEQTAADYCPAQGTWCNSTCISIDRDTDQTACIDSGGNCNAYDWNTTSPEYESGNPSCCGDDVASEYRVNRTCATGICTSDDTDWGCCGSDSRCVYDGLCYSNGETNDTDNDGWLEKCKVTSPGEWVDGDAPKYSDNDINDSEILTTEAILIYTNWSDNYDLNYSWLWTNETGAGVNYSSGVHGSAFDINLSAGETWSNFTWQNTSIEADNVIAWKIYANDSEGNTNVTAEGTFEVKIPDATFAVAMPTSYDFNSITSEEENTATETTPSNISFNFTTIPEYWIEPCAGADCDNNKQDGTAKPIYLIDATGNVPIDIGIKLNASLPAGLTMCGNASCTGSCTPTSSCTAITNSYVKLIDGLSDVEPNRANITLYANLTGAVAPGEKVYEIIINASYQGVIKDYPALNFIFFNGLINKKSYEHKIYYSWFGWK